MKGPTTLLCSGCCQRHASLWMFLRSYSQHRFLQTSSAKCSVFCLFEFISYHMGRCSSRDLIGVKAFRSTAQSFLFQQRNFTWEVCCSWFCVWLASCCSRVVLHLSVWSDWWFPSSILIINLRAWCDISWASPVARCTSNNFPRVF